MPSIILTINGFSKSAQFKVVFSGMGGPVLQIFYQVRNALNRHPLLALLLPEYAWGLLWTAPSAARTATIAPATNRFFRVKAR